jgi:8-oxo-dGTP diphosphatase
MQQFNIRVYGLLFNDRNEILVSDECRHGISFTKFPGGGLEFGEGLKDALKREFDEELAIAIEPKEILYVNDFYQASSFDPQQQLISFYFRVHFSDWACIAVEKYKLSFTEDGERRRWISLSEISGNDFTFPIDKVVAEKIKFASSEPLLFS